MHHLLGLEHDHFSIPALTLHNVVLFVSLALLLWTIYGVIYRLYLSPIAHIPGPWFAKLTFWNEFYYDVWLGGKYTWVIPDYHKRYGPVIRINPYEVHIMDSDFLDQLFVGASKGKVDKWDWTMRGFGLIDTSAFLTLEHSKHRMRRDPWNPYFSKASVSRLQPLLIQNLVNKLCDRLSECWGAGKTVIMTHAYACLTADVISEYTFPEGHGFLDQRPDFTFNKAHYDSWAALGKAIPVMKQFGFLVPIIDSMPPWLTFLTSPAEICTFKREEQSILRQTKNIVQQLQDKGSGDYKESTGRSSMIEAFLTSRTLPTSEKKTYRIHAEAVTAMAAGTLTTTHALKHATYHVLANPAILSRLLTDLKSAIPDLTANPPNLRTLESIDYLMAVWYETLRIWSGTSHRLSRIFPDRPLVYKGKQGQEVVVPAGTPISMTPLHIHDDETIFPNPYFFDPERWLPLQTNGARLQKYLAPFGKGTRQCVGMELGKAEVLTTLASLFLRFGHSMQLIDCDRERDIDTVYDNFAPMPSKESNRLILGLKQD